MYLTKLAMQYQDLIYQEKKMIYSGNCIPKNALHNSKLSYSSSLIESGRQERTIMQCQTGDAAGFADILQRVGEEMVAYLMPP